MAGELIVVYDLLPEIAAKIEETAGKVVRKAAFDIIGHSMAAAPVGPTGFLKNSHYAVVEGGTNEHPYSAVQAPAADQTLLPEVEKPAGQTTAAVALGASYAWFVEYGTVHMPARPFFTPAVEKVRPEFEKALDHIIESMELSAVK